MEGKERQKLEATTFEALEFLSDLNHGGKIHTVEEMLMKNAAQTFLDEACC